ncbi:MAG TPA: HD-GYP domain-containing protein [Candidatus Binatia bacterium]|nr:HD-GYP domain-containing protein [Candidatus Binatia bacterium]
MLIEILEALEKRDRMRGHGERVAALAEATARRLGWDDERLAQLRYAAPLHDIGKVAVPAHVLAKRLPLDAGEIAQIRRHPLAGASLVRPIRSAHPALPYVLHHHERWDGGGYPNGLAGAAIPIGARVVAVADAFDAMTSPRPYRRSIPIESALVEVERCAGTQFDPDAAEAFLDVWEHGVLGDLPAAAAF